MKKLTCGYLSFVILLLSSSFGTCKFVSVSLDARWPSTPISLEIAEHLAKEDRDLFWRFVDESCRDPQQHEKKTEFERYTQYKQFVTEHLSGQLSSLLDISLGLRAHSPAVNMNHQLLRDHLSDNTTVSRCSAFVILGKSIICEPQGLQQALATDTTGASTEPIYKTDKVFAAAASKQGSDGSSAKRSSQTAAFLYGELGTQSFCSFHAALSKLASEGQVLYVLRHFVKKAFEAEGRSDSSSRTRLSGYGVELAIKSTEYKAKDDAVVRGGTQSSTSSGGKGDDVLQGFDFSRLRDLYPSLHKELDSFQEHLRESTKEIPSLAVWQLQDLSYQASQCVMTAGGQKGLQVLRDMAQNYPMRAKMLSRVAVNASLRSEVQDNQRWFAQTLNVVAGGNAFFLNGIDTDIERFDIFTSLDRIRDEIRSTSALYSLGFRGTALRDVITVSLKDTNSGGFGNGEYALNVLPALTPVTYLNNLERDEQYRHFLPSLNDLLRPMFPGSLPQVKRNLFNILIVCDPLAKESRHLLTTAESFYVHTVPARIGVILLPDPKRPNPISALLSKLFHFIEHDENAYRALSFITDVFQEESSQGNSAEASPDSLRITRDMVQRVFQREYDDSDWSEFERHDAVYNDKIDKATEFFKRSGFNRLPQVLINGIPLSRKDLDEDEFESALGTAVYRQLHFFQTAVYHGRLSDADDILDYVMRQPNVVPRLNHRVISALRRAEDSSDTDRRAGFVDFGENEMAGEQSSSLVFDSVSKMSNRAFTAQFAASLRYLSKKDEPDVYEVSNWVVLDFDSVAGRELALESLKHLKSSTGSTRIAFINNPSKSVTSASSNYLARVVQATIETVSNNAAKNFLTKILKPENAEAFANGTKSLEEVALHGMDVAALQRTIERLGSTRAIEIHAAFAQKALGLQAGARAVVSNGRLIGPLDADEAFTSDDLLLIDKMTLTSGMSTLRRLARSLHADAADRPDRTSDLLMRAACALNSNPQSSLTRTRVAPPKTSHAVLHIEPTQPDQPALEIDAVVDPLSKDAQKLSHLLVVLAESLNVRIRVWLNPREKLSEPPLRNFYRFILDTMPSWNETSGDLNVGAPTAYFNGLPERSLLTLNMDTPHSWMVEAVRAVYDLDNIVLQEVPDSVHAEYELEYLLIEGHCTDTTTGQPPRGAQFTLGTRRDPVLYDTIVMANLGYFQLKSSPGAWTLRLRSGRSADIYKIAAHDYTDSPADYEDVVVVRDSLSSKIIRVKLEKKPDRVNEDVLGPSEDEKAGFSIWNSITRSGSAEKQVERDATLNIFSLASGHLYERFLRLMMLSVLKHTKSRVKFWFLKNYLSPAFKSSISYMAEQYGFEYELVQYSWPRWLHAQTEKQRVIWGYKILFLDVLFPLDVRKVIFVDADQIVRADLQELYDLDLEGAPYGYTPFCDSRKEMDGFRFWRSGYWAQHLGQRRYHISALYVIDLVKFRRIAAGDRLRGQYQALSQDPNSLSNLDQDLPNNMIHQVAIKSLPQEWLWCETWCSDSEKTRAKTIDLCNNPQTKEPKLSAAMRIIPEWQSYDDEIKKLLDKFYAGGGAASTGSSAGASTSGSSDQSQARVPPTTGKTEL